MKKIGIVDYRLGNLFSVNQACKKVGLKVELVNDPEKISNYSALIFPGVGSFKKQLKIYTAEIV